MFDVSDTIKSLDGSIEFEVNKYKRDHYKNNLFLPRRLDIFDDLSFNVT